MKLRFMPYRFVLILVMSFGLSACDTTKPVNNDNAIALADCRIKDIDSVARCAFVSVPEDHANPQNGKTITIHVAVLPSLARRAEPDPVYFFAGGPGQAASDIGRIVSALGDLRKHRDIVLVDQRGTGKSKTLTCVENMPGAGSKDTQTDSLRQTLTATDVEMERDRLLCLATLKGNPAVHRTDDYIDDLELVRKALGQQKINVWGGSYGSRVALRYMKRYPNSIRTAVLDGVAPTTLHLPDDALQTSEAELRSVLAGCAASVGCSQAYPNTLATFDALLATLKATPVRTQIAHPGTGVMIAATISDRTLVSLLWPLLYQPEATRMVPSLIGQAAKGNFAPLAATATASSIPSENLSGALRLSVVCAEDMLGRTPAPNPRFDSITQLFYAACKAFPHGKVAPEFFEPTISDIPALLLSGNHDPVTPPAQANLAAKTLSQHKQIVVMGMGHIVSIHPCVRRVLTKFVDAGVVPTNPDHCEADLAWPMPLFYTSPLEAKP